MDADKTRPRYTGILTLLVVLALFLTAHSLYLYFADAKRFPITTVKIAGTYNHVTHQQLEEILGKYWQDSFFTLPVGRVQADLDSLEWTAKTQVERIWPDILKITFVEKIPIAIWNSALLTKEGEIFNDGDKFYDVNLPKLTGPTNQLSEVLQVYKKMSKILTIYGLKATALDWHDNEAWELTLSNGVRLILGKRDLEMRVKRFCKAYPAILKETTAQLISVDLRYPRGMAVQWQKQRKDNG